MENFVKIKSKYKKSKKKYAPTRKDLRNRKRNFYK